jgi:hypothetical protein
MSENTLIPRSVYFHIKWAFLDMPINRRKLEKEFNFVLQLITRCKDLGCKESKRIFSSPLNYEGIWWVPGRDMVEIKELLEDCGYEIEMMGE